MFTTRHILVPVDHSDVSRAAVSVALQVADRHNASVTFLHIHKDIDRQMQKGLVDAPNDTVVEDALEGGESALTRLVEEEFEALAQAGIMVQRTAHRFHVSGGDWLDVALQVIADDEIDLVVSGTHGGKTGIAGLFQGSVTEKLVSRAPCSVFVVKPKGFPYLRD
jgi:nucleotide-binding universal stress UspA family protein